MYVVFICKIILLYIFTLLVKIMRWWIRVFYMQMVMVDLPGMKPPSFSKCRTCLDKTLSRFWILFILVCELEQDVYIYRNWVSNSKGMLILRFIGKIFKFTFGWDEVYIEFVCRFCEVELDLKSNTILEDLESILDLLFVR
jgi:hypothetical protein